MAKGWTGLWLRVAAGVGSRPSKWPLSTRLIPLAKRNRTAAHPRHKMTLTTIGGVACEQARIYRACLNGKLKPSDMCRMMFGLREIRISLESIPEPPLPSQEPATLNIVSVPTSHFVRHIDEPDAADPLMIEHIPANSSSDQYSKIFDRTQTTEPELAIAENEIESEREIESTRAREPIIDIVKQQPRSAMDMWRAHQNGIARQPVPADGGDVYQSRARRGRGYPYE
jgi:hypothetical protein